MPLRSVPARGAARPFLALAALTVALAACGDAPTGGAPGADPATLSIVLTASAGSATSATLDDRHLALAPGDSARLTATLRDARGGARTPSGLAWTVVDRAVADVDAGGLLRAKGTGSTVVIASAGQAADTVHLVVSTCGSATAVALEVGQVRTLAAGQGGDLCVVGAAGAEYALVPVTANQAASPASLDVTGTGLAPLAAASLAPASGLSLSRASLGASLGVGAEPAADAPAADEAFHLRLHRSAERLLAAGIAPARAAYRARRTPVPGVSLARVAATAKVGDLVSLNTASAPCKVADADRRVGRVAAVTQRAIVIADTLNPANGFTDAEYRNFGVAFDTLAYPVDVANFGEPSDIDGNGKVLIFFTSAVNALTPRGASYYVGGFFYSRDLFPSDKPSSQGGCAGSNDAEMFYMLVPDPAGTVNGNRRSKTFVSNMTVSTLGHEFQHLINSSRRLYVNDADDFEDTWLDEGLAHVAEELVFYRAAGLAPRGGLTGDAIRSSTQVRSAFNEHATGNLGRLQSFLEAPESNSPFADNDELETRGATWSFLRYSADRLNGRDSDLWQRLVNAKTSGRANLQAALGLAASGGATLDDWERDWAVATYADRQASGLDARYTQPSWNFRDVFAAIGNGGAYPLVTRTLADGRAQHLTLGAGSAGYLRFAVAAGKEASLRLRDAASPLPASVRLAVVRTR
jgi:hypothetical protein